MTFFLWLREKGKDNGVVAERALCIPLIANGAMDGAPVLLWQVKEEQGQQQIAFADDNRRQNNNDSKGFLFTL